MQNKTKLFIESGTYVLVLVLLSFSQSFCTPDQYSEIPLVVINGDTITSKNIDRMLVKTHKTMDIADKQSFDYNKLLTKSINDLLILQDAYAIDLDENEYLQNLLKEKRKDVIRNLYLSHSFQPNIVISDKEIKDYYEANLISYQFRTISLSTLEEAQQVYELLQQGYSFDSLSTAKSLDHRRFKEGLHTVTFKMNVEDILLKATENLKVGEYTKPTTYQQFQSIIKLEKKSPADWERFDTFKQKIIDRLTEQKKEIAWYKFIDELLLKYPVTIDSLVLEEIKADKDMALRMEFRNGTEKPVLSVNDEYFISDNQLRTEVSHTIMNAGTTPFETILLNSINKKQEELLSTYSAVQNGYWDSTRVVDWYYQQLDSSLIEIYLKEMVVSKIAFNSEEFKTYYDDNIEKFRNSDKYLLDQMMITDQDLAFEASQALKDGAQWSYILKKYSAAVDQEEENSNWVSLDNYIPEVREELSSLQIGQTSSAFQANNGFVIFKIKDQKQGSFKSIEDVDMEIRGVMFQQKFNKLLDEHINKLKENSKIVYINENIDAYFGKEK